MRRPIFGNGIPRNIQNADGVVEVFDTEDLDEGAVYALTLYLWWFQSGAASPFVNPELNVFTDTGSGNTIINRVTQAFLDTVWDAPAADKKIAPLKVLDRYMTRGTQKVLVENTVAASDHCWIWGYLEQVGDNIISRPFRGLQPGPLEEPFTYPPGAIGIGALQSASVVLHQLSSQYIDILTLDVLSAAAEEDTTCLIKFPGGVEVLLSNITANGCRMLDGIPMRAPTAADVNISLEATTVAGEALVAVAFGSFDRQ